MSTKAMTVAGIMSGTSPMESTWPWYGLRREDNVPDSRSWRTKALHFRPSYGKQFWLR